MTSRTIAAFFFVFAFLVASCAVEETADVVTAGARAESNASTRTSAADPPGTVESAVEARGDAQPEIESTPSALPEPTPTAPALAEPTSTSIPEPTAGPTSDPVRTPPNDTGAVRTSTGIIGSAQLLADGTYAFTTPCYEVIQFESSQVTPVPRPQVLIDPGHGGDEIGSQTSDGVGEKDVNLTVSLLLRDLLDGHGISADLTRDTDYRLSIQSRTALANSLQPELLVSVHHNGGATLTTTEPPVEVFHQQFSPEGKRLGGLVFEEMKIAFSARRDEWSGTPFTGVQPRFNTRGGDLYGMLRRVTMPSVITEAFYLDGTEGDALVSDEELLAAEADALLRAIQRFMVSDATGSGFVDGQEITLANPGSGGVSGCQDPDLGIDR